MMRVSRVRSGWVVAVGAGVALGAVTVVVGAPMVKSSPFTLPSAGTPPVKIWEGPATKRVSVKLRATQGAVRADAQVGGATTMFCRASVGVDAVIEGGFDAVQLAGVTFPTGGTYELREMAAHTASDRLVGAGSVTFAPQAAPVGSYVAVYASDAPRRRLAVIRPSGSAVTLRSTEGGAPLLNADGGDWAFAIVSASNRFVLSAAAAAGCAWEIHDVEIACGPFSGTAAGVGGEVDAVYVDGQCPLTIALNNPGPATVRVTYQRPGQAAVLEDVLPNGNVTAAGALSKFEWTYLDPTPARPTTVSLNATIQ